MNLQLTRPIVAVDLETTGLDPVTDRVVEISCLRVEPNGGRQTRTHLVNPGCSIPEASMAVHGIDDDQVRGKPSFAEVASEYWEMMRGCDVCGYNVRQFDLPLLLAEFRRAGIKRVYDWQPRVVDAGNIFRRKERRRLEDAVRFYLHEEHEGAHSAESDALVTWRVLDAQLARYPDLARDVASLAEFCQQPQ